MTNNFENWKLSYDVLEPIKAPIDPHKAVGTLIDINDEKKQNELELSGSDLDNIRKSTFGLIDLYENIYVTPQQIRKEEKVESLDLENEFFHKFETGEKIDSNSSKDIPLNRTDDIDSNDSITKKYEETQSIEKPMNQIILNNLDILRVLKVPVVNMKCEENVQKKVENVGNMISKDKEIQKTDNYQKITTSGSITTHNLTANIDNINKATATETDKAFDNNNDISSMLKTFKNIDLNKSPNFRYVNNQLKANTEALKTITLDKKTYAKRQIKSEVEKLRLTKGPDLYEKSVILPQIMKRLTERNNTLQEDANLKRRLVLDSKRSTDQCQCKISTNESNDTKKNVVQVSVNTNSKASLAQVIPSKDIKLNPIIALENCNRERLVAHRVHSAFEKYVLTGSYY